MPFGQHVGSKNRTAVCRVEEPMVVLGLIALGAATIAAFMKLVPIVELPEEADSRAT